MRVILGSSSPRRREILKNLIENFEIINPLSDENCKPNESPVEFTRRISVEKLNSILEIMDKPGKPELIITSDTIVTIDDLIIGKPSSYDDALGKLELLNGRTHQVITSITLFYRELSKKQNKRICTEYETTDVTFKKLQRIELKEYLKKIEYMDKAGAYAFQNFGNTIIERTNGSLTNIIGFPLRLFFSMSNKLDIQKSIFS